MINILAYKLIIQTITAISLAYINNSIFSKRFMMAQNQCLKPMLVIYATRYINRGRGGGEILNINSIQI